MTHNAFRRYWFRLLAPLALVTGFATAQGVEVVEETDEHRVVRHALGETRIPAQPERVVSLTVAVTNAILELGLENPVGAAPFVAGAYPPHLADDLAEVPKVGNDEYTLNLEAILAQQPDLILLYAFEGKIVSNLTYEQLSQIAPTIAFDWAHLYDDFRTGFLEVGAVLGVPEKAAARLAEHDAEMAELRAKLTEKFPDTKLSILVFNGRDIRLRGGKGASSNLLYNSLGFDMPAFTQELAEEEYATISLESVSRLGDADVILLQVDGSDEEIKATLRTLEESTLWRSLPAVQQNRVLSMRSDLFLNTPKTNERVANEFLARLIGQRD